MFYFDFSIPGNAHIADHPARVVARSNCAQCKLPCVRIVLTSIDLSNIIYPISIMFAANSYLVPFPNYKHLYDPDFMTFGEIFVILIL